MKKQILFSIMLIVSILLVFYSCTKKDDNSTSTSGNVSQTLYPNPEDSRIISIDSAGRKVVYMGVKDASGMPVSITQALVDAPDLDPAKRTLIQFDIQGRVSSLSNNVEGFMEFQYISDTSIVILFTQPNNQGTFLISFNPQKPKKKIGDCGCAGTKLIAMRTYSPENPLGNSRALTEKNLQTYPEPLHFKPSSTQGNIYLMYNQTLNPVKGAKLVGTFVTKEGLNGPVAINPGDQDGHFLYTMPSKPAPPEPPAGFGGKAKSLLNLICIGSLPVGLGVSQICLSTINPMTIAACTAILTAYVWICRTNTVTTVGNFVVDLFTTEATVTITAMHPLFPTKVKVETGVKPSQGVFPEIVFGYDDYATIQDLYTTPADPDPQEGYIITARIENGVPGIDEVTISMVGTDGYTKTQKYTVDATGICSMSIPGATQGVRDEITAEITTAAPKPGQVRTITIVF